MKAQGFLRTIKRDNNTGLFIPESEKIYQNTLSAQFRTLCAYNIFSALNNEYDLDDLCGASSVDVANEAWLDTNGHDGIFITGHDPDDLENYDLDTYAHQGPTGITQTMAIAKTTLNDGGVGTAGETFIEYLGEFDGPYTMTASAYNFIDLARGIHKNDSSPDYDYIEQIYAYVNNVGFDILSTETMYFYWKITVQ